MVDIRLSPRAELDIEEIALHGLTEFGVRQAEKYHDGLFRIFELMRAFPMIGPDAGLPRYPDLRRFAYGAHVIFYSIEDTVVIIRRVLHGRMDARRHL